MALSKSDKSNLEAYCKEYSDVCALKKDIGKAAKAVESAVNQINIATTEREKAAKALKKAREALGNVRDNDTENDSQAIEDAKQSASDANTSAKNAADAKSQLEAVFPQKFKDAISVTYKKLVDEIEEIVKETKAAADSAVQAAAETDYALTAEGRAEFAASHLEEAKKQSEQAIANAQLKLKESQVKAAEKNLVVAEKNLRESQAASTQAETQKKQAEASATAARQENEAAQSNADGMADKLPNLRETYGTLAAQAERAKVEVENAKRLLDVARTTESRLTLAESVLKTQISDFAAAQEKLRKAEAELTKARKEKAEVSGIETTAMVTDGRIILADRSPAPMEGRKTALMAKENDDIFPYLYALSMLPSGVSSATALGPALSTDEVSIGELENHVDLHQQDLDVGNRQVSTVHSIQAQQQLKA